MNLLDVDFDFSCAKDVRACAARLTSCARCSSDADFSKLLLAVRDCLVDRAHIVASTFWQSNENENENDGRLCARAVDDLSQYLHACQQLFDALYRWHIGDDGDEEVDVRQRCARVARNCLVRIRFCIYFGKENQARQMLVGFFQRKFERFERAHGATDNDYFPPQSDEDDEEEDDNDNDNDEQVKMIYEQMKWIGLMELSEEVACRLLFERVEAKLRKRCAGRYDVAMLNDGVLRWADEVVFGWLGDVLGDDVATLTVWRPRVENVIYEQFARLRIGELFDIIVEMPDSVPALDDLRLCLAKTQQYGEMIESLRAAIVKRLLHPGAATSVILTQFISTIKAFHVLDPSGVTLAPVSRPIRAYLAKRSDTVRQIVASLTDASSDLHQELMRGATAGGDAMATMHAELDDNGDARQFIEDDGGAENMAKHAEWQPAPPANHPPREDSAARRRVDIIATLVSVYGSQELFVKEYKRLLAERLLSLTNYDTDVEDQTLELLKLRFGEAALTDCVIMLKDIYDSKRIDKHVHEQHQDGEAAASSSGAAASSSPSLSSSASELPLHATIVSGLYWPMFRTSDAIELPPSIDAMRTLYDDRYEKHKATRKLEWMPHVGSVDMSLSFGDGRTLDVTASPLQAAALHAFSSDDESPSQLSLADLSASVGSSERALRKAVAFWIGQRVLREVTSSEASTTPLYEVVEHLDGDRHHDALDQDALDQDDDGTGADQLSPEEELKQKMLESTVVGMLNTFSSALPVAKIHMSLSMFVDDFDLSMSQTLALLYRLVAHDLIDMDASGDFLSK
jgi:anaphase-promoting complex subunit 2